MTITALDLFAGTGWGVACKRLGIHEQGVEIMPEAVATREANGMETIYRDVWDGLRTPELVPDYKLLIASPPCQTFSLAGKGSGRKALDDVLGLLAARAYALPGDGLRKAAEAAGLDDRTALVLSPLAYVFRDEPTFVAFEQVPTVLPVWEACAEVMREWGYSVKTAVLNAEQYGVPQTRKRAILVARRGGEVSLPDPTHSRYYSRDPKRLDEGVLPWVSMAEALGWGHHSQPSPTITGGGGKASGIELLDNLSRVKLLAEIEAGNATGNGRTVNPNTPLDPLRMTVDEAAALQTFPGRGLTGRPSPTITGGGVETGGAEPIAKLSRYTESPSWIGPKDRLSVEEVAALQSYPRSVAFTANNKLSRAATRALDEPAPTITGANDWGNRGFLNENGTLAPASVEQVSTLQSFPERPFVWKGSKSKQYLQVGNAVPPLLAEAVLAALTA